MKCKELDKSDCRKIINSIQWIILLLFIGIYLIVTRGSITSVEARVLLLGYFFLLFAIVLIIGLLATCICERKSKKQEYKDNATKDKCKDKANETPQPSQAIIEQYRMVYQAFLHHDRRIWEIPAVASAINAGLLVLAFRYNSNILERDSIIAIAALLTFGLFYASLKHRYFVKIEERTLREIEQRLGLSNVQRTTYPADDSEYYYKEYPSFESGWSAHNILQIVLAALIIVDFALILFM